MGIYYEPARDVITGYVGRELPELQAITYDAYTALLAPGEHLYLAAFNGYRWLVVYIDSQAELDRTYHRPEGKSYFQFFALPATAHTQSLKRQY